MIQSSEREEVRKRLFDEISLLQKETDEFQSETGEQLLTALIAFIETSDQIALAEESDQDQLAELKVVIDELRERIAGLYAAYNEERTVRMKDEDSVVDGTDTEEQEGSGASDLIRIILEGGVGVIPTDTIYGVVASALYPESVERIYELKRRDPNKPQIVLIANPGDIEQFGVVFSDTLERQLMKFWPGPNSIILPTDDLQFEYLTRGTGTIAFRVPDNNELRAFLRATGPLVAPSANPEGSPPATTVEEAQRYFGTDVDFYSSGGVLTGKSSTILELDGDAVIIRRP